MHSPQNCGWWRLCLCLSSALSESQALQDSQAVFRPGTLGKSCCGCCSNLWTWAECPWSACHCHVWILFAPHLLLASHMKLGQVGVPDSWPCLCLPHVCHLWMLMLMQMAVEGWWSVLPVPAVAVSVTLSLQVVSVRHQRLGGLSCSSCFLQPCSSLCVRMPAWSLGGIPDRCMHGALALLQLPVIAVTSAETRVLKGTHLLCLFLSVSWFSTSAWYVRLISGCSTHVLAGKLSNSLVGLLEEIICAKRAVACNEIALQWHSFSAAVSLLVFRLFLG